MPKRYGHDDVPHAGTTNATDLLAHDPSIDRADAVSLGNDQRIRERVTKVTPS